MVLLTIILNHLCENGKLIFLYKKYAETRVIADLLVKRGFQDFGKLLIEFYAKQKMYYKTE